MAVRQLEVRKERVAVLREQREVSEEIEGEAAPDTFVLSIPSTATSVFSVKDTPTVMAGIVTKADGSFRHCESPAHGERQHEHGRGGAKHERDPHDRRHQR